MIRLRIQRKTREAAYWELKNPASRPASKKGTIKKGDRTSDLGTAWVLYEISGSLKAEAASTKLRTLHLARR
jgi:hypothetical protein